MNRSVLFVCLGNICRSPAGECMFRKYVEDEGIDDPIQIDSAGTSAYHIGEPPDSRMRESGRARGVEITGKGRQFEVEDFEDFDLIVAMDQENLSGIHRLDRERRYRDRVRLLCDFIPNSRVRDVPDPYYGGPQGFDEVLNLIEDACPGILETLLNGAKPAD